MNIADLMISRTKDIIFNAVNCSQSFPWVLFDHATYPTCFMGSMSSTSLNGEPICISNLKPILQNRLQPFATLVQMMDFNSATSLARHKRLPFENVIIHKVQTWGICCQEQGMQPHSYIWLLILSCEKCDSATAVTYFVTTVWSIGKILGISGKLCIFHIWVI